MVRISLVLGLLIVNLEQSKEFQMIKKIVLAWIVFFLAVPSYFLAAQTPVPTATAGTSSIPSGEAQANPTPVPTAVEESGSTLMDQIKVLQKEITELSEKRSEAGLFYNYTLWKDVEELMREKVRDAKKARDTRKARELTKDIDDLEAARKSKEDEDLALLEDKSKLQQLTLDRIIEYNRKLADQFQADGNQAKVQELNDGLDYIKQMKGLEDQNLQLNKDLLVARENCDFKTVDEIRQKQEDLEKQFEDLNDQTKTKLQMRELPPNLEEQENL